MVKNTIILFVLVSGSCLAADESEITALRHELDTIKQTQADIQQNVLIIKGLLTGKRPLLENVYVEIGDAPSVGSSEAAVIMVEFTDFQCPFCAAYQRDTFGRIVEQFIKPGKLCGTLAVTFH